MKKLLASILTVVLIVSLCPFGLFTFSASAATTGTTGDCTWSLDGTVLTISGNGEMGNYSSSYQGGDYRTTAPWGYKITKVIFEDSVTSIGDDAFRGCSSLTSVTIGKSVTSIGKSAFWGCSALESITVGSNNNTYHSDGNCLIETATKTLVLGCKNSVIPTDGSVTSIDYCAFYGCSSLTYIIIPDSVTSIGYGAFNGCSSLTSITIPDSVTSIDNYAFLGCSSLTSITIPDSVTSIGDCAFDGCSSLTSITIPNSVTSIGDDAFYGCSSLTSVTIGKSVTSIGDWAFYGCSSLTSITIPDSMTSIGNYAFRDCDSLTSITIPDSVTSIGSYAFEYCSSLTSVTIGKSVTSIGYSAFQGCSSLESITVGSNNNTYHSDGNCLIETATKTLVLGCKNSVIPTDGSVTSIGKSAFWGCDSLTSITIPNSVTSIGEYAFYKCSSLDKVFYLGSQTDRNNISIGDPNYDLTGATWHYNELVDDVLFYTFDNTKNTATIHWCKPDATSVTIPATVTKNGKIYGVAGISYDAFSDCINLSSITVDENNSKYLSINNCVIDYMNFELVVGCKTSVIPTDGTVTKIGSYAFYDCDSLTSITIPNSVTSIGAGAFGGCSSLTSITIPDSVTSIGKYAFSGCSSLTSITIPNSVTSIGYNAFYDCDNLETLNLNATSCSSDYCYYNNYYYYYGPGWHNLKTINFGENVETIGQYMFYGCDVLTSITIPDSVTSIGEYAFYGCSSLKNVYFRGTAEEKAKITIGSGNDNLKNASWHYNSCIGRPGHSYDNNSDVSCNVCGFVKVCITKQPTSVGVANGQQVAVKVTAVGDGLTYKWYYKEKGGKSFALTTTFTGNTYSVAMNSARNGRQLYCVVTDKYGNSVKSNVVTISMKTVAKITKQPTSVVVANGQQATVKVTAVGDGLTYKWYYKEKGGKSFALTTTFTGNTYSVAMNDARNGRQLYCVVTDRYGNSVKSNVVTISMKTVAKITKQPTSVGVANGEQATVKVTAVGDGLTYKWYFKEKGGKSFALTTTFTGNTYSVAMNSARNGRQLYCVVKDKYGNSVKSNVVTISMKTVAKITKQPTSVGVANGQQATVKVTAVGDGLTYKWYFKEKGGKSFALTTTFTGNTYSVAMNSARNGRQLYCVVTDKYGNSVKSNVVTISMKTVAKIKSNPTSVSVAKNTNAKFTVTAVGDGLKYQWQVKTSSTAAWKGTTITGYNTKTITVPATSARNRYQYRCIITDKYGNKVTSGVATLTLK